MLLAFLAFALVLVSIVLPFTSQLARYVLRFRNSGNVVVKVHQCTNRMPGFKGHVT